MFQLPTYNNFLVSSKVLAENINKLQLYPFYPKPINFSPDKYSCDLSHELNAPIQSNSCEIIYWNCLGVTCYNKNGDYIGKHIIIIAAI